MNFSLDEAKKVIENGIAEAQELLKDPEKIDDLLRQMEEKLGEIPVAGSVLADVPQMIAMVKGYITKEYTAVSVKVIASLIAAFIYLIKRKDLIPDSIPLVGLVDDLAVLAAALLISEPELKAFAEWRDSAGSNI